MLLPKRLRGVYLGYSENNSAHLIGTISSAGRFSTYETRDVSFCEDVLVHDVRALDVRPKPDPPQDEFLDSTAVVREKGEAVGVGKPTVGAVPEYIPRGFVEDQWIAPE